ncbi:MAG TPA: DUF1326 domain-containing protein [Thermoplasmata archaeon]|nr:DUF1326 domain-containing protein [Thermoplasmata archaeon]
MASARWSLEGDWVNSCNCDSGCPCLFYADPTKGSCEAMDAFHIRKGKYGDVALDGLNVVVASKSPGNFWKGNWTAAVYFDEKANAKQKAALETLFMGKAGGPLAMIAGMIGNLKGSRYVPIAFDGKAHKVSIPGVLEYQLKPTEGGNKGKPIQVLNNPMAPDIDPMNMGIGLRAVFNDYGMSFDNSDKDGNWAPFKMRGP